MKKMKCTNCHNYSFVTKHFAYTPDATQIYQLHLEGDFPLAYKVFFPIN